MTYIQVGFPEGNVNLDALIQSVELSERAKTESSFS